MDKHLEVNVEKCTGCRLCELACSAVKTGAFNPRQAHIKVTLVDIPEIPVPTLLDGCDYCFGNPVCVGFCNTGALVWKEMESRPIHPKPDDAKKLARVWLESVTR